MAVEGKKELLRQIPRVKLWLVLGLTGIFAVGLLAAAHITHSLTIRVEAYHALYNLLSLSGCLLTMKLCELPQSLHNTFGWARLDVLSMITSLLFLLALCFSVTIEAVQTAVHAEHQDPMHYPLRIMILGGVGLCLNALVFALIGGYTHHQGCFLEMRDSGSVWVGRQVTQEAVQAGRRMLSSNDLRAESARRNRVCQVIREVLRDALGLVIVEICAAVVHWDNGGTVSLYIDPALAVTSAALLIWFSYPYGRECGHILLQTIPGHIDVEAFHMRVLQQFPAIVNIHHLHIWTFTPSKVVATAHVVFSNTKIYLTTQPALRQFFIDEGITHVTIQPECMPSQSSCPSPDHLPPVCLLRCQNQGCHERECCPSCSTHPLLAAVTATHPTHFRKRSHSSDVSATDYHSDIESMECKTILINSSSQSEVKEGELKKMYTNQSENYICSMRIAEEIPDKVKESRDIEGQVSDRLPGSVQEEYVAVDGTGQGEPKDNEKESEQQMAEKTGDLINEEATGFGDCRCSTDTLPTSHQQHDINTSSNTNTTPSCHPTKEATTQDVTETTQLLPSTCGRIYQSF